MAVTVITSENFEEEVTASDKPVLVDFWADWCTPCKMLSPVIEQISDEVDTVKVGKVNVDEQSELASKYGIMSIPALILFKDGTAVDMTVGVQPKDAILKFIGQ